MWSIIAGMFSIAMILFIILAVMAKKKKTGKMKKWIVYAVGCFILTGVANSFAPSTPADSASKQEKKTQTATATTANTATTAANKETLQAELQALGDWGIKSSSDDFANRYGKIQSDLNAGDRQSAYDEATMASKRADDLNSKTMNNQDMDNVPKDIPSNARDTLSGVDSHLAQAYMLEKQGFDTLADGINNNDLSKIDDAKSNFSLALDEFNQAKALIDKANGQLK